MTAMIGSADCPPARLAATRDGLHRVAEHLLAAARRRDQADLTGRGVPGGGQQVLRDAVQPVAGGGQAGGRAVNAADHGGHACFVSPGVPVLPNPDFSPG